jgi:hypothetical protein
VWRVVDRLLYRAVEFTRGESQLDGREGINDLALVHEGVDLCEHVFRSSRLLQVIAQLLGKLPAGGEPALS